MDAVALRAALEVVAELAPRLAGAGVRGRVHIGEVSFELEAPAPVAAPAGKPERERELDPLDDPDTFGGGQVPRLTPRSDG